MRLPCPVGDTQSAKSSSFGLLRCIPVDIISPGDLEILETCRLNFLRQLCWKQSTCNSTCPPGWNRQLFAVVFNEFDVFQTGYLPSEIYC